MTAPSQHAKTKVYESGKIAREHETRFIRRTSDSCT